MAKSKRVGIRKLVRFEVLKRDGFKCTYCGEGPPDVVLVVDHVIPVAKGGGNEEGNLTTACKPCNQGKAARQLSSVPQPLADKAAQAALRESEVVKRAETLRAIKERIEDDTWDVAEIFMEGVGLKDISSSYFGSIERFVKKLPTTVVIDAMQGAVRRFPNRTGTAFRYFCGTCWRIIKGGEDESV